MYNDMEWGQMISLVKKAPDLFIDIGVGVVHGEAWHCRRDWPNAKIVGFEPCPTRYNQVKDTFPGILHCSAVMDKVGKFTGSVNHYDFKIDAEVYERDPYLPFEVDATTVDEIAQNYDSVFVWADVEGAESVVVKGALESMTKKKVIGFNLEFWPNPPTAGWCRDEEVMSILKDYGFVIPKSYLEWDRVYVTDFVFVLEGL